MATDFSEHSERALNQAAYLAKRVGAELYLVHVFKRPVYIPGVSSRAGPKILEWIHGFKERVRKMLVALGKEIGRKGVKVHPILKEGAPLREILKTADEISADLIVLGAPGRTGLDRFMLGSVAERLARRAPCPVLIARPISLSVEGKRKAA